MLNPLNEWFEKVQQQAVVLREFIAEERGRQSEVYRLLDAAQAALVTAEEECDILEQSTTMLQGLEAAYQHVFQQSLADIVSRGLTILFDEPIELKMITKVRADVSTIDLHLIQGTGKNALETKLMGSTSGTYIVIINVLLHILFTLSAFPPMRRFLVLDEPWANADPDIVHAFGELLQDMQEQLGFQIMLVTHNHELIDVSDTAFEARPSKKGTYFRQLRDHNEVRT